MDKLLALACFAIGIAFVVLAFPDGNIAILVTVATASLGLALIRYYADQDRLFLTRIFIIALLARLGLGLAIHYTGFQDFFAGDVFTYDEYGNTLMRTWFGLEKDLYALDIIEYRIGGVGWGMLYFVAAIYTVIGRNFLAAQSLCAVFGAGIAPLIYICSFKIFRNMRAAKAAAIVAALYPSFIIWTSQLLKDGLIIFLLVLCVIVVLHLQEKFSLTSLIILVVSLLGIISLRFYVFYIIAIAIVGALIIAREASPRLILRNLLVILVVGLALTYFGVIRYAGDEFEKYGTLERVQIGREDQANTGESGYGRDLDVSTVGGAVSALPIGMAYLYLAPFPWEMINLRQAVTLPDMVIWWGSLGFLLSGLLFAIRQRLRGSIGILIFTFLLSIGYALSQGNVGTAYRQRAQIQVFMFIFVGVGWTLFQEKRENKQKVLDAQQKRVDAALRANREEFEKKQLGD